MEIISTYIESLDKILGGGVINPSTILIAGTAGTGRTTLGIQSLCTAAKEGENVLYVAVTPKSANDVREILSRFDFFEESIHIHTFEISLAERDPLTMLVELGNIVASKKPDRILIDPVTPLGFGFPEAERRRFMYSLSSAIQEWKGVVYLTGILERDEIHGSVISDIVDGILYLSQETTRFKTNRSIEIIKMSGMSYMEGKHDFEITNDGITIHPTATHGKQRSPITYEPYIEDLAPEMDLVMRSMIEKKEASPEDISTATGVEESRVTEILAHLEQLGYVIRTNGQGSERYKTVLTGIGQASSVDKMTS